MSVVIRASGLSKTYELIVGGRRRVAAMLGDTRVGGGSKVEALSPLSFDVHAGETVGLIGTNGSGKSTLLKLLAGVSRPTSGTVSISGAVSALLELGTGFHPEFSGRENLMHAALLAGLSRADARRIEPEVIEFSELGDVIDDPIKTYSTGMAMRLGFAVAHAIEPEVLLIDEVLAVGDAFFQLKCYERLRQYSEGGGTFLFVSHDLSAVLRMCQRALWLDRGKLQMDGPADEVIDAYYDRVVLGEEERIAQDRPDPDRTPHGDRPRIEGVSVHDSEGRLRHHFRAGEQVDVQVKLHLPQPVAGVRVRIGARRRDHLCLLDLVGPPIDLSAGAHVITARFDPLRLGPAEIFWFARLEGVEPRCEFGTRDADSAATPMALVARPNDVLERGALRHDASWRLIRDA